jgi:hypothetical protein
MFVLPFRKVSMYVCARFLYSLSKTVVVQVFGWASESAASMVLILFGAVFQVRNDTTRPTQTHTRRLGTKRILAPLSAHHHSLTYPCHVKLILVHFASRVQNQALLLLKAVAHACGYV